MKWRFRGVRRPNKKRQSKPVEDWINPYDFILRWTETSHTYEFKKVGETYWRLSRRGVATGKEIDAILIPEREIPLVVHLLSSSLNDNQENIQSTIQSNIRDNIGDGVVGEGLDEL